jgi:hypothetical protein
MKRLILFLCLIISILLLSGCDNGVTGFDTTPPANQTMAIVVTQNSLYAQRTTATASVRYTAIAQEILRATAIAEQIRATQVAQEVGLTRAAAQSMQTSTAAYQQTADGLNVTRTSQALAEISNQIAYQAQQQQIDIDRRRMLNSLLGWTMFLVILAFFAVLGWGFWLFLRSSMARRTPPEPELPPLVMWDRNGRLVTLRSPPVGNHAQIVDASFSRPRLRSAGSTAETVATQAMNAANVDQKKAFHQRPEIPAVAPWRRVAEEWRGGALPIGMTVDGMAAIDTDSDPHLLLAGTAGSGKTRFAMRPLAAAALADGWQVVLLFAGGTDYDLFREHPNAVLSSLGQHSTDEAIRYLERMNAEMRRRVDELERNHLQSWRDWGDERHRTMVMMDDFQNVITGLMSVERRTELWQLVRSIAAEGHRAGIHLFMAIQDPSYTDLDLRVRRYMSPMCFRVSEALISRVVVNTDGAETLYPRQWMAILNDEVLFGFAFAPDDTDILRFLDNHPQPPLSFPAWLQELE